MLKVLIWQTKFGNTRVRRIPHFILSPLEFHEHEDMHCLVSLILSPYEFHVNEDMHCLVSSIND